jgi:hypothetical protein
MALKVPKQYEADLALLVALSQEEGAALINAVSEVPSALQLSDVSAAIAAKANLTKARAHGVLRVAMALYEVRSRLHPEKSIEDFSDEVVDSFDAAGSSDLRSSNTEQRRRAAALLRTLLAQRNIAVTARARSVMQAHEHVFFDSRVLSDLRPVFTTEVSDGPAAAVLIHNLKISYSAGNVTKDFYVALDSADLEQLKHQLDRATLKARAFREMVKKMDLTLLEPSGQS